MHHFLFFKVTAALSVMFKVDEVEPVVKEMFSRFFADLLLRIGVSVEVQLSSDVKKDVKNKKDVKKKIKPPTASQYVQVDTCTVLMCNAIILVFRLMLFIVCLYV